MFVPRLMLQLSFERDLQNIQVIGDLLETAVAASWAGDAQAVMLRQDKFYRVPPVVSDLRAVRIDDHAFFGHIVT